jgi:hypothetical protein
MLKSLKSLLHSRVSDETMGKRDGSWAFCPDDATRIQLESSVDSWVPRGEILCGPTTELIGWLGDRLTLVIPAHTEEDATETQSCAA